MPASVALDYAGPAIKKSCTKSDVPGGYEATASRFEVTAKDFVLVVTYRATGGRSTIGSRRLVSGDST